MGFAEATVQSGREVLAPGQRVGDHLVVRSILGQGGTAIVYEALHTRLGAPVALKVLEVEEPFVRDAALRLQREAEVCANLDDPHVPRIYDVGALEDGTPYLVMEKISGATLEHMLAAGPLPLRVAAAIADDLLRGLEAVHRAGVVHRDIKPANLMIKLNPEGGAQVRLMDFGVSKSIGPEISDPKLTRTGMVVGTPHYMAPEQITADAVDARADLYAAGVVLYEVLSGRTPYEGATTAEVVAAVLRSQPQPLSSLVPDIPPRIEGVVMRAMATGAQDRFPTARDMRLALAEALREPVLRLRPEPEPARPVRRSHARRWAVACVSLGTLVGTIAWPGSAKHDLGRESGPAPIAKAKEEMAQPASAEAGEARFAAPAARVQGAHEADQARAPGAPLAAEPPPAVEARDALLAPQAGEAAQDVDPVLGEDQGASLRYRVGLAGARQLALDIPDPMVALEPTQTDEAEPDEAASRARPKVRTGAESKAARASTRVPPPVDNIEPVRPGILISDYLRHLDAIQQEPVELPESHGLPAMSAEEAVPPNPYAE